LASQREFVPTDRRKSASTDRRDPVPEDVSAVGYCPRCLRTYPVYHRDDDAKGERDPPPEAELPNGISGSDGGVALLLAIGLLDSLATNRRAIQALVERAEAAGVDVFLALDRISADDSIDAHADLRRRRRQLESMLE
jgi:hypothetical protein